MAVRSQGVVDPLDFSEVLAADGIADPKLTLGLPTGVTNEKNERSALTLKNLVRQARVQLLQHDLSAAAADEILAPATALVSNLPYWRMQSRGLVVFAAPGFYKAVRVPIELQESVSISEQFNLLPLAPVLASDRKCYVLSLSKNAVRLFDSTRNTIEELPLENVPGSFDEVIDELPEKRLDVRAGVGGPGNAPIAHGSDADPQQVLLERYIRAVGQAIGKRLGTARSQPLVLAAVAEYLPIFQAACPYPAVFDGVIAGNPEQKQADELRSAAWRLLGKREAANEAADRDRARSIVHNGRGSFDLEEIAAAAAQGRVETLFLPRDDRQITAPEARELANRALIGTLRTSGTLRTLDSIEGDAIAVYRY